MLVVGIDGGGTKTEGIAMNAKGEVVASARSGGVNLNFVPVEECERSVTEVVTRLAEMVSREEVVRVYSVMVPDLPTIQQEMRLAFPNACWHTVAEHRAVLAAGGILEPYGIGVVAGTGSSIVGWNGADRRVAVGGWGMLLGDEGSATDIAIHAIRAVLHAFDGRGEPTALHEHLLDYFHVKQVWEITHRIFREKIPRHVLAGFAQRVSQAADGGDRVAQRILQQAGEQLGNDILSVARRLFTPHDRFPVVLGGGVFRAGEWVVTPLTQRVLQEFPHAHLFVPDDSPAVGLARLALANLS